MLGLLLLLLRRIEHPNPPGYATIYIFVCVYETLNEYKLQSINIFKK